MCRATLLPEPDRPLTMTSRMGGQDAPRGTARTDYSAVRQAGRGRVTGPVQCPRCERPGASGPGPAIMSRAGLWRVGVRGSGRTALLDVQRVVIGELFLVLLDAAVELVGQRIDGRVHVLVDGVGVHLAELQEHGRFG